jgi:hypothetical protein
MLQQLVKRKRKKRVKEKQTQKLRKQIITNVDVIDFVQNLARKITKAKPESPLLKTNES